MSRMISSPLTRMAASTTILPIAKRLKRFSSAGWPLYKMRDTFVKDLSSMLVASHEKQGGTKHLIPLSRTAYFCVIGLAGTDAYAVFIFGKNGCPFNPSALQISEICGSIAPHGGCLHVRG